MQWNRDINAAPRGKYRVENRQFGRGRGDTRIFEPVPVILATKCGKVLRSEYLPDKKRWLGLSANERPVAWMAWPEHPGEVAHASLPE